MLLLGTFLCVFSLSNGQFTVEILQPAPPKGMRHAVERCDATGANFGSDVATFSFSQHSIGCPVTVDPSLACGPVTYNPDFNGTHHASCSNLFAIVPRGTCNFSEKAYHVQGAKPYPLSAIIVYNDKTKGPPVDMNGGKYAEEVKIPVLMVSYDCMNSMMNKYPPSHGYVLQIKISPGYYDLFRYLIPFVVVVGFCFMVLLISLAIRLCRERRRIARKRLSKRNLRKIPTKKFRKGDYPETCAICLEDFIEGEKLRVLPCRHTYHCHCIDPWLTQNRKVCPMCKRRVGAKNSDSESSDDERRRQEQPSTSGTTEPSSMDVIRVVDEENPSFETASQPESSSVSNVLVEVHHNNQMGSQEQLVGEDFLAQMENHISDDETEPQESMSQSFRNKIKNIFNRSGHRPLEEEEDDDNNGRVNSGFQGSTLSVAENRSAQSPHETTTNAEQPPPGYQFRDPFEHNDETGNSPSEDQRPVL